MNTHLSVVIPEYKGAKMVHELVYRIVASVSTITEDYEIILVNDASPDDTWNEIIKECGGNRKVKGLDLSRNFGQHYAITAGLAYAKGDWVVVMDCDLQDRPEEILNLYKKAQEGYDIVQTRRVVKHVGWWKRMSSIVFYAIYGWISGKETDPAVGNFGIYKKEVINQFNKLPQQVRSFGTLLDILGFRKVYYELEQDKRGEGKSSYTLGKLLKLSMDVIIVNSNKPLRMSIGLGFLMAFVAFGLALYNVIAKWLGLITVSGYTSTIFSIWFVGGLLLSMIGVIGLYIGKIFDQVKGHPLFIVQDQINFDNQ